MNDLRKFHILLPALAAALACACAIFGVMLMQSWREYSAFEDRRDDAQTRLAELNAHNTAQEKYLTELLDSPALIERAARENLNFSRDKELIFKFED